MVNTVIKYTLTFYRININKLKLKLIIILKSIFISTLLKKTQKNNSYSTKFIQLKKYI